MITTPTLLIALFALRKQTPEESEGWNPSAREANELHEALKAFPPKEVNGRKQYAFELYCEKKGIISFGEWGQILVRNPLQYHRALKVEGLRNWIQQQEQEKLFQAFPEEKVAWEKKIAALLQEWRLAGATVKA